MQQAQPDMSAPTAQPAPRDQSDPPAPQAAHQALLEQPALLAYKAQRVLVLMEPQVQQAHPG